MKQHLLEFDLIRALAALAVIAIHITGIYSGESRIAFLSNQGMRFAVPLFIILSGILLAYTDNKSNKEIKYVDFLVKRLKKVIIPYIIWTVIYAIYAMRYELSGLLLDWPKFLSGLTRDLLFGTGSYHLYFVLIIAQMYILYLALRYLIDRWPKATLIISFIITFYFQTGIYLEQIFKKPLLPNIGVPYYILFTTWIFYFVFGMFLVRFLEFWKNIHTTKAIVLSTVIWMISYIILVIDSKLTLTQGLSIKPSVMLYTFTSLVLFYFVSLSFTKTANFIGKFLDWFSSQSFMIYFSHVLLLKLIWDLHEKLGIAWLLKGSFGMMLIFTETTVLTCIFVYIFSYTKAVVYLGGINKKKVPSTTIFKKSFDGSIGM